VHIGCGDGLLTAAFCVDNGYLVHGLDTDRTNIANARRHIMSLGLYGKVSVDQFAGDRLPYTDNLVNLVVSADLGNVSMDEVLRVLCPNGTAYIKTGDTWAATVKPRPDEIDEWTHYLHDATGNAVANDSAVGPPRRFQWVGSPRWSRHHDRMASMSACVSAGGRIFYIMDEGSRTSIQLPSSWTLVARDAFNGTILWKKPISSWITQYWPFKSGPAQLPRRLVAAGDKVYVTLGLDGTALSELDAATGRTIRTYQGTEMTHEFIFSEGILLLMVKDDPPTTRWNEYVPIHRAVGSAKSRVAGELPWDEANRRIVAIVPETGQVLWEKLSPVAPLTLAADSKGVYFHDGDRVVCLDRHTGDYLWTSATVPRKASMPANFGPTLVVYDSVVLFASGDSARTLTSLSAQTGQTLWKSNYDPSGHNCPHDLLVTGGLAWAGATAGGGHSGVFTGWDLRTGRIKKQFPPDVATYWFHQRCYRARATDRFIMPSRTGIEFVDFGAEHWTTNHWVRGGCLYGIMPCNGLVYAPPHNCACYAEAKLSGFCALAPEYNARRHPLVVPDEQRLTAGPAYGELISAESRPEDWPTYRHDAARSGFTQSMVPSDLRRLWQTQLEGRLSSLTVAGGRVYVASVDAHTLHALDQETGRLLWSRTVGGRVDSPPTIYDGRVLFGSADGSVYCLRASDGELIWRFLAAPQDLRMTAFEQLESLWPVHGSVLVKDGIVYCVAGRSMFLDGGLRLLSLDAVTGEKISESILDDRDPETGANLQVHVKNLNMPVALPDILSSDGQYFFMRSQRFSFRKQRFGRDLVREQIPPHSGDHAAQGSQQYGPGVHLFSPYGFLDGTWFHRSYWVFGRSYASGAGGYYRAGRYAPAGRIMAFDDSHVYGFGRQPQYFKWTTPMEYQLFAARKFPSSRSIEYRWTDRSPSVFVRAMAVADKTLFVAGPPDIVDEEEAFDNSADPNVLERLADQDAALKGAQGMLLQAISVADGSKIAEYNLESLPVWDGMAVADGRLYLSMENGTVQSFAGTNYPPTVDAGEDQRILPFAGAVLDATVADDGFPRADPCDPSSSPLGLSMNWTELAGPGQVGFADPYAAETTASFSQWGDYTLRLTVSDGDASTYDDVNVHVSMPGDLDFDNDVDMFDMSKLAAQWLAGSCDRLNDWCGGADQTGSGAVDLGDFAITAENWLAGVNPDAPTNVAVTPGQSRISLDWDDNREPDIFGYYVYRSHTAGSDYTRLNQLPLRSSQYVDTGAADYSTYHYVVTAVDTFGYESAWSNEVSATAGVQPVMELSAGVGVTATRIRVSAWQDQAGANDAVQGMDYDQPWLVESAINGMPAISFDGTGRHLKVADSRDINTGGPYSGKTLVVIFKAGSDISTRQVIWEQGGAVRGLSFYLDSGKLYVNGWNLAETEWGPTALNAPVRAGGVYVATLVLNAGAGIFEGSVNGVGIGAVSGVDQLHNHSNDCAFGHVEGATMFHDGATAGPAGFSGFIAEFRQYNQALSDGDCRAIEAILMEKYGI
jgi:outer membrane protein assembly factor BamB